MAVIAGAGVERPVTTADIADGDVWRG